MRREFQESLPNDMYVFLIYYISNARHMHSVSDPASFAFAAGN